jgi:hypothetical protein
VGVTELVGSRLPPGRSNIAVSISGSKAGTMYPAAGVLLTYRDRGRRYEARAWGGGIACIATTKQQIKSCFDREDKRSDYLMDYIHTHG